MRSLARGYVIDPRDPIGCGVSAGNAGLESDHEKDRQPDSSLAILENCAPSASAYSR